MWGRLDVLEVVRAHSVELRVRMRMDGVGRLGALS